MPPPYRDGEARLSGRPDRARAGEGAAFREMEGTTAGLFPYDEEAIVGRGEIVPRSLVGRDLGEPIPDLSGKGSSL
jgi:hypothetical protein